MGRTRAQYSAPSRTLSGRQIDRLESVLRLADYSLPSSPLFDELVASRRPDALLVWRTSSCDSCGSRPEAINAFTCPRWQQDVLDAYQEGAVSL